MIAQDLEKATLYDKKIALKDEQIANLQGQVFYRDSLIQVSEKMHNIEMRAQRSKSRRNTTGSFFGGAATSLLALLLLL